jgi:hypothetical protein
MPKMFALSGLVCVVFSVVGCKPEADRLRDMEAAAAVVPNPEPQMPDQVAKAGVGVKGNSLDDIKGNDPRMLIAGPAKAYFNVRERMVFEIQLPSQSNNFYASNGRYPKTHEEYMREIVGPIPLPSLPQGMVYRYHPDDHELWVEAEKPNQPAKP